MRTSARNRHIPLDEKLTALQEADFSRRWFSLDERRVCACCNRVITGRMIDAWQDERGDYHLHCPTPGCTGAPKDWFHHGVGRGSPNSIANRTVALGFGLAPS